MKTATVKSIALYSIVGTLAIGSAFYLATALLLPSSAQQGQQSKQTGAGPDNKSTPQEQESAEESNNLVGTNPLGEPREPSQPIGETAPTQNTKDQAPERNEFVGGAPPMPEPEVSETAVSEPEEAPESETVAPSGGSSGPKPLRDFLNSPNQAVPPPPSSDFQAESTQDSDYSQPEPAQDPNYRQPERIAPRAAPSGAAPHPDFNASQARPSGGGNFEDQLVIDVESFLEPYIYDTKGRRDPFEPYYEARSTDEGVATGWAGPLLPLQRFELDQIKLIGIIWDVQAPKAMFVDPNKQIHVLGKDERIGRNNGYVAAIREGEVVIVEATQNRDEIVYTSRVVRISQ